MPLNTENYPLPDRPLIEKATAAPGELRDTQRCYEGASRGHPCQKPLGHSGKHLYEWGDE